MSSSQSKTGGHTLARALPLRGKVQGYTWGKIGAASRIARMLPGEVPHGPLAEYWIGGHPKGCADVELPDGSSAPLTDLVLRHGELVGSKRWPTALPFMVKVLSVDPTWGLSIQAHPDPEHARALHGADPLNYPDTSHKPEVGIPLSPVTLLYGFKSASELKDSVQKFPELKRVLPSDLVASILSRSPQPSEADMRRGLLGSLLHARPELREAVVREIGARCEGRQNTSEEERIFTRLRQRYGDADVGLLVIFIMNVVTVLPGEAIFIGSNIPHAYLDGDLVEVMACSDNVVRAGLTPKFKDIDTLIGMLDYSGGLPQVIRLRGGGDGFVHIELPVHEFEVSVLPHGSGRATLVAGDTAQVLLALGKKCTVRMPDRSVILELSDGGAVLIPPQSGRYEIERDEAALYRVVAGE